MIDEQPVATAQAATQPGIGTLEPRDRAASGPDFLATADSVLRHLDRRAPMGLWAVTRVDGDRYVLLSTWAADPAAGFRARRGTVLPFRDTVCHRMVRDLGPRVAPVVAEIPSYASAPLVRALGLGSYVGVPITVGGRIFGTICGIDREPRNGSLREVLPTALLGAEALGLAAESHTGVLDSNRWADPPDGRAGPDGRTGLVSRQGFLTALGEAEGALLRTGRSAGVVVVDVADGLVGGPGARALEVLRAVTATVAGESARAGAGGVLARTGATTLSLLLPGATPAAAEALADAVAGALAAAGVPARVGSAVSDGPGTIAAAWVQATAGAVRRPAAASA